MEFSISIFRQANQARVSVVGELDLLSGLRLRPQLDDAMAQGCNCFIVDVRGVTFVDAAGMDVFVHLYNEAIKLGGFVTFTDVSPTFRRVCNLAGLTGVLRLPDPSAPTADDMATS